MKTASIELEVTRQSPPYGTKLYYWESEEYVRGLNPTFFLVNKENEII